jgi:hypothetical protein
VGPDIDRGIPCNAFALVGPSVSEMRNIYYWKENEKYLQKSQKKV